MTPFHTQPEFTIYQDDAGEVLPVIPDASVSLIATDPPYHRARPDLAWDNQWPTADAYLAWLGSLCQQWRRVLRGNGSLYCFASPEMAARVECEIGRWFNVLNRIVWRKDDGYGNGRWSQADKEALRSYFPQREEIVFAEQFGSDEGAADASGYFSQCESVKRGIFGEYLSSEFERAGVSRKQIAGLFPSVTGGLTGCVSNWLIGYNMPTPEQYEAMRAFLNGWSGGSDYLRQEYDFLRREYEDLRREYEDLRREYEDLRRPFFASADSQYTDVWDFPTVSAYPGKHPCEKPLALAAHIVRTSSRPGDTVLDCFAGSGVFGEAAVALGRHFIGIEQDPHWAEETVYRLQRRLARPELPVIRSRRPPAEPTPGQMRLFGEEAAA